MRFFTDHFRIIIIDFRLLNTFHSELSKYGTPFFVPNVVDKMWSFLLLHKVFGKRMKLLRKIKNVHILNKEFIRNSIYFRHTIRT